MGVELAVAGLDVPEAPARAVLGVRRRAPARAAARGGGRRPGGAVLDVGAAPGSKRAQYCEAARLVAANDADPRRAYILASKLRSLGCSSKCVVTCHRGQAFPATALKFDRVACDVPCSGDGTLRKRHSNTPNWSAQTAEALHVTQLRLLREVMAPDGLLMTL